MREGDDVMVIGAGPIETLMTRMSVEQGARPSSSSTGSRAGSKLARRQGGTPVPFEDAEASVADATHGRGVDVAIARWASRLRGHSRFAPSVRRVGSAAVGLGAAARTLDYVDVIGKEATITGSFAWTAEAFARALGSVQGGAP